MSAAAMCTSYEYPGALLAKSTSRRSTYVVGFMFDSRAKYVVLIRKEKPAWQQGLYNGVGGKIEASESGHEAMAREFEEETGLKTYESNWRKYGKMTGVDWECELFYVVDDRLTNVHTTTAEQVSVVKVDDIMDGQIATISNLPWLISMAIDDQHGNNSGRIYANVEYR